MVNFLDKLFSVDIEYFFGLMFFLVSFIMLLMLFIGYEKNTPLDFVNPVGDSLGIKVPNL